ncbi:penicillin acylase family protein [Pseudoalteromonas luteoviolacea]|uniref:Penicillin amidase n=1 Tax=Pseudoalteromonas luteoviolacea H33 TaxID=1365251 RepID=A0A167DRL1_9GAMM|nr:penicillin acylase family protein [Pseudoalteromonas luteoviolacea]KZN49257.1 hypothetical protein N476_19605 [Pseudoalteromonas luteoviolacea H33]KZN74940.1 hypothetical protein N477_21185 [Pseudoalteromonas luteoviolacea H33-S]MBQ4878388.1 penicillin acylase family protein [Pseudoalteromonas luteoviolacea]MBQ4907543.1 penicillin acylase family protein [Pseudoalteromonas luteoviolacea]
MLTRFPIASRFGLFIIIPLFVVFLTGYNILRESASDAELAVILNGINDEVVIVRDEAGIPAITGKSDNDVFFAMGFIQAQDRLWQMEYNRRLAQGRLSEVFGIDLLDTDKWMRTLGLYRASKKALHRLGAGSSKALESYTQGVNAWINQAEQLPAEFELFDYHPEPWSPVDSIAIGKLFALTLGGNAFLESRRQISQKMLSEQHYASLFPDVVISNNNHDLALASIADIASNVSQQQLLGGKNVGSNAWVISGKLTENGSPILANDPHLALQIPSVWYAAKLKGENITSSGMTLVGMPIIIFGTNNHISWGGTSLPADVQDLVSLRMNPDQGNFYQAGDKWLRFEEREEVIHIAPGFPKVLKKRIKPVKMKVLSSVYGPVVSDFIGASGQTLSLQWSALEADDTSFEALYKLNYAQDWKQFRQALSLHVAPSLNILYADKNNNIGISAAGKIPVRNSSSFGMLPTSSEHFSWNGYLDWGDMPYEYNPDRGFIVNANNKSVSDDYRHFISNDWADPARADRITDLIHEKVAKLEKVDVAYVAEMQHDLFDLSAESLLQTLGGIIREQDAQDELLKSLYDWNRDFSEKSNAAAIYMSFLRHLKLRLFKDEFIQYHRSPGLVAHTEEIIEGLEVNIVNKALTEDVFWCDNVATTYQETCKDIIPLALKDARDELTELGGSNMDDWRWQQFSQRTYKHQPFSQFKHLEHFFEREAASNGSPNTINVASYDFDESEGYIQFLGATFRQIIEMSDDTYHVMTNSTGQSGNVFSQFYDDMLTSFDINALHSMKASLAGKPITLRPSTPSQSSHVEEK